MCSRAIVLFGLLVSISAGCLSTEAPQSASDMLPGQLTVPSLSTSTLATPAPPPPPPLGKGRKGASAPAPAPTPKPVVQAESEGEEEEEDNRAAPQTAAEMRAKLLGGAQAFVGTIGTLGRQGFNAVAAPVVQWVEDGEPKEAPRRPHRFADNEPDSHQPRTASEIKSKYGRGNASNGAAGATSRANNVRDVVNETRNKLAERGERIERLDQKAGDMENGAAGFQDLAHQVLEMQKNRKWWQ